MPVASHWLTAPRVRRLAHALSSLPERPPGLPEADCRLHLWRTCGGPINDVPFFIDVLAHAELITRHQATVRLTQAGRRIASRLRSDGSRLLALALIRSGLLHDQAHRLIDTFEADPNQGMTCRLVEARPLAPQLLGLLQHWPTVRTRNAALAIPTDLVAELTAGWTLLPPPSGPTGPATRGKAIGDRAELYSWQLERQMSANPSTIAWVARDDETLGYDIEDRTTRPHRRIEVKGSGGRQTRFVLSHNEWRQAHDRPNGYEVHFWGGIDLNRPVADEYDALRADGYPLVFTDLPALVAAGVLEASPDRWTIAAPAP